MPEPTILVFVRRGVCEQVWSDRPVDVEVIDLDGDYRKEGEARLAELEGTQTKFQHQWRSTLPSSPI